ncbi:MAG: hypothetical protein DIU80_015145 [Chloroflexota bacterium]
MTTIELDQVKLEAFAERMLGIQNDGALALMIGIGLRTGLLDKMAQLPPATSAEIAAATRLRERYVREWLAALVTGGIIEYNPDDRTYALPPEHAAWLTRAASPNNLAAQFIPPLDSVEDGIVAAFRSGGLHHHEYPRSHEVMAEDKRH